jgi:hypothetical protein
MNQKDGYAMDHEEEEKKGLERRLKEINFVVWR